MDVDMDEKYLFRPEVLESRKNKNYGSVSINMPGKYVALTMCFSTALLLIFLFLIFGEFSEKYVVLGYLESTKGIAPIYSNKNGVIAKRYFKQGDDVKEGDKLFLIDTTYERLNKKHKPDVLVQLEKRAQSIAEEMAYKEKHLQDLKRLLDKNYISMATYHEKQDELRVLERQKNTLTVEIINYKNETSYLIRSPIDGMISSVSYQEGQYANLTKPLAKILPAHSDLIAQLFIPVRQSGFLHHKNKVIIQYDAYPYARFGTANATINEISRSILTDEEEDKPIKIGHPYYKVMATLDKQFVTVYGKEKKIQHGMTFSAVIVGSKRKIWQWIFDPLYSFYGSVNV